MIPETQQIMSVETGMVGYDKAMSTWTYLMSIAIHRVDVPFSEIGLTRGNRALPLPLVILSIKIQDEPITVGPTSLFQRISTDEDLVEFLKYMSWRFSLWLCSTRII
uniref:Uncharacterized protein n=1 Tax=Cacopsylla melanoneura TaxID=428564 RepID=A0A8D8QTC0_9HEMI